MAALTLALLFCPDCTPMARLSKPVEVVPVKLPMAIVRLPVALAGQRTLTFSARGPFGPWPMVNETA